MGFTILECFTGEKGYLSGNHDERLEEIVVDEIRYFIRTHRLPNIAYRFIRESVTKHEEAVVTTVTDTSTLKKIARRMLERGYFYDPHDKPYVSEEDIEREYLEKHTK